MTHGNSCKKKVTSTVGWAYSSFLLFANYFRRLIPFAQRNERYSQASEWRKKKTKKQYIKKHQNQQKRNKYTLPQKIHTLFAPAIPKLLSEDFQSRRNVTLLSRNPFQKKEKVTTFLGLEDPSRTSCGREGSHCKMLSPCSQKVYFQW